MPIAVPTAMEMVSVAKSRASVIRIWPQSSARLEMKAFSTTSGAGMM